MTTAESTLISAEGTLSLKQNGSTSETIHAEEAVVMQRRAGVESAQAKLSKMTLRSPQNGIITKQDAKVGEIVTPGKIVISVISDGNLEIESDISEISIGKIQVGNPVSLMFDAFPGETFAGKVTYIEPAETIIDGVVNYKVTVGFDEKYPQMKSGLTSKLEIQTAVKAEVLVVPQYALVRKDSGVFVSKKEGKAFVEVPVTVGLTGQDGNVEVLSGLSEGDVVQSIVSQ
jgi:RND family efflux transporter MFP subunit